MKSVEQSKNGWDVLTFNWSYSKKVVLTETSYLYLKGDK